MSAGIFLMILAICVIAIICLVIFIPKFYRKHKQKKAYLAQLKFDTNERRTFGEMMVRSSIIIDKAIHFHSIHFAFDRTNKKILIKSPETITGLMLNFSDVINYELLENGQTIHNGSTGNAIAGALLFGVAGAVVGSTMHSSMDVCALMQLRITVNNIAYPSLVVTLLAGVPKNSILYVEAFEFAKQVIATLDVIKRVDQ